MRRGSSRSRHTPPLPPAARRRIQASVGAGRKMRARSKLMLGQPGTCKLLRQYGERLVCLRYRYDATKRRRYTTAEIIVSQSDWAPMPSVVARREQVGVAVEVREVSLRAKIKAAGGRWDPYRRVWFLPMEQVLHPGLTTRLRAACPLPRERPRRR